MPQDFADYSQDQICDYASRSGSMPGDPTTSSHRWVFLPEFPVKLAGPPAPLRRFWREQLRANPALCNDELIELVTEYRLQDKPIVATLQPNDADPATLDFKVLDGKHLLAASVMAKRRAVPLVLCIPIDLKQEDLPPAFRANPLPGLGAFHAPGGASANNT
jgi:hypothetical protein